MAGLRNTPIAGFKLRRRDILGLPWWFELELRTRGILNAPKQAIKRFTDSFENIRKQLQAFEDDDIRMSSDFVEVDGAYLSPDFQNWRRSDRRKLRKTAKTSGVEELTNYNSQCLASISAKIGWPMWDRNVV